MKLDLEPLDAAPSLDLEPIDEQGSPASTQVASPLLTSEVSYPTGFVTPDIPLPPWDVEVKGAKLGAGGQFLRRTLKSFVDLIGTATDIPFPELSYHAKEQAQRMPTNPEMDKTFWLGDVPSALGSAGAFAVTGVAGGPLLTGALGVSAQMGQASDEISRQIQAARSKGDQQRVIDLEGKRVEQMLFQAPIGLTESIGVGGISPRILKATPFGRAIQSGVGRYLFGGTKEGLQEVIQGALTDAVTKYGGVDPNLAVLDPQKRLREFGAGFIVGAPLEGVQMMTEQKDVPDRASEAARAVIRDEAEAVINEVHPEAIRMRQAGELAALDAAKKRAQAVLDTDTEAERISGAPTSTPLTDTAIRETSTEPQPQQETPNASQEPTAAQVGVRGEGGEVVPRPPLRQQGQAAEARPEVQAEVTPPEQLPTERTVTPNEQRVETPVEQRPGEPSAVVAVPEGVQEGNAAATGDVQAKESRLRDRLAVLKKERSDILKSVGGNLNKAEGATMLGGLAPTKIRYQGISSEISSIERQLRELSGKPEVTVVAKTKGTSITQPKGQGLLLDVYSGNKRIGEIGRDNLGKLYAVKDGEIIGDGFRKVSEAKRALIEKEVTPNAEEKVQGREGQVAEQPYDIETEGRQMGLTPQQIDQAKAEGVTNALGLRRIEKKSRGTPLAIPPEQPPIPPSVQPAGETVGKNQIGVTPEERAATAEKYAKQLWDSVTDEKSYESASVARAEAKRLRQIADYGSPAMTLAERDELLSPLSELRKNHQPYKKGDLIRQNANLGGVYKAEGSGPLFRGVSLEDWNRIQREGFVDTDKRGVISPEEEMNLADNPETAATYIPNNGEGVVLAIDVTDAPLFMIKADDYIRASGRIPVSKIISVSPVFKKGPIGELFVDKTAAQTALQKSSQPPVTGSTSPAAVPPAEAPKPTVQQTGESAGEAVKKPYVIGKHTTVERQYGIDVTKHKFPARKVTLASDPEASVQVYKAKSGWIVNAEGTSFGKDRRGFGWTGFDTPKAAVENFLARYTKDQETGRFVEKPVSQPVTAPAELPKEQPAEAPKPEIPASQLTPEERATASGQKQMAKEAASVATVMLLNKKVREKSPSDAWSDEQITGATGNQKMLDTIRDDLLPIYNRLYAKQAEAPKPAAEVPKALVTLAKSPTASGSLPDELRQYSEQERAGIAKAIGTTDSEPEALSDALIERYAVNKTETPSPFPRGEVGTEARQDEIDALAKADEGNDWTEATGPEEIPITPKPSRQAMGITPSGSSAIGKVLVGAKEFGKRIKQAVVNIAEFSDFRKSLLNWSARGQKSSDEIMRAYKEIKQSVPNPERREAITNWIQAGGDDALLASRATASPNIDRRRGYELARTLTPEEKAVAQKIRDTFDILRRRAEKYGIEINEIENYVTQIWKRPPREFWPSSGNRLSGAVRFAKARTFESFFAGEQAGWKPQTKDISKLLPIYMNEINNAINARQFVSELAGGVASDGRPLLAPSGIVKTIEEPDSRRYLVLPEIKPSEVADYKRLEGHPALHSWRWRAADENGNPIFVYGDLSIHPEAFSHLRKVLGQSALREWWREPSETVLGQIPKSVAKFLIDDVQQVAKATMLGFFSPFHLVQEGTHGIGHKVNPFYNIPKIDMRDPGQMDAARHSLMLQPDRISAAHFKEGLDGHSRNLAAKLAGKIPGVGKYIEKWSEQFQQWLFHQYIPGLKYKTYQHIYERNLKRYADHLTAGKVSDDQVKYLSAQQANAAYGHLNYADMGRNPTIQHIMQTFLLAPDFLEARGRFAAQAAKGLVAKSGREQAVAMATLAGTFWVAARILNQLADDDPHWDKPFEVVVGNRRYRMRSVPEDIYMLVKDTRSFIYGRLSPLIGRGTIEGFSGVNYRGEPTSFWETLTNIVGGMIPLSVQPMTRGLTETGKDNPVSPFEQFLGSIGLHVSRYSPVSETYKLAGNWLDKNADTYGIDRRKGVYPRSKYVALRNALDDGDFDKAKAEIENLKTSEKVQNYELRQRFAESVNHPFTGSNKTDDIFRKTLDERGKALFDSAKKRRELLLQRFDLAKERIR